MVRNLCLMALGICNLLIFNGRAQEFSSAEIKDCVQKEMSISDNEKMVSNIFDVADVNRDGFVSENEFSMIVKGIDTEFNLSEDEKTQKKERFLNYFKQADKNKDVKLDKNEFKSVMQWETENKTKERLQKIEEFTQKSPEEAIAEMQKKLDAAKTAIEKVKEISPEEMADNFINSVSNNIADENYFQMDKDKDGCVTADEYAEYMVVYDKNMSGENNSNFSMTKEEWKDMYKDEKKAKENCLTKEEYIRNFKELSNLDDLDNMDESLVDNPEK